MVKVNYPENVILKSEGSNASEQYLSRLCNETFLSLWSYPNLFRDQGRVQHANGNKKGDGKELCDLLIVFENHIIIFSDKFCAFQANTDIKVAWSRWYKNAIRDAANQILGAERWIKDYPDKIYLDSQCENKLPIQLEENENLVFHRVVVAHGASDKCKDFFDGGSGSLMIDTSIEDDEHWNTTKYNVQPFSVGHVCKTEGFIHVFDDTTLGIVMQTLDTVTDFINYLEKKEDFLQSAVVIASGEEDMLATYLMNTGEDGEHFFVEGQDEPVGVVFFAEGSWNEFQQHKSRIAQIEANKISYFWDELIEKFLYHMTTGTSILTSPSSINEQEKAFRLMAKENRTRRRALSSSFLTLIEKTPPGHRATRMGFSSESNLCYVFLLLPCVGKAKNIESYYSEYRKHRKTLLESYLMIAKIYAQNASSIIGIALETFDPDNQFHAEDLACIDVSEWTEEDERNAKKLEQEFIQKGYLAERYYVYNTVYEYPESEGKKLKGKNRNLPCPCGSGKKYKKCCGQ